MAQKNREREPEVKRFKKVRNSVRHLLSYSFQSLATGFKQSSGRAGDLAGRLASKHHAGTGQTGPMEDLDTRDNIYRVRIDK